MNSNLKRILKEGNFVVENLYTFKCKSKQDVYDLLQFGLNNQIVAYHRLDQKASRSNTILTLTIESVNENDEVRAMKV